MAKIKEFNSYRITVSITTGSTYQLQSIPDSCQRVYIRGYEETREVEYDKNKKVVASSIHENKYYVDYNTGLITFGKNLKNKSITIIYYSRED